MATAKQHISGIKKIKNVHVVVDRSFGAIKPLAGYRVKKDAMVVCKQLEGHARKDPKNTHYFEFYTIPFIHNRVGQSGRSYMSWEEIQNADAISNNTED